MNKLLGYVALVALATISLAVQAVWNWLNELSPAGWVALIVVAGAVVWFAFHAKQASSAARRDELLRKYGNPNTVERILRKEIWVGQTSTELVDAIGRPESTDEKLMKTAHRRVFK